jgi:N,N'-diacetyllegionaminate synthase
MVDSIESYVASGRCIVIGEIGQAHDGSLGMAHALIDGIADAGAQAVKFQTHIAHAESTKFEPWRVKFSLQDASRYDYWKRMEFTEEQWLGLRQHAEARGLLFLSSPFSVEAADLLARIGLRAWKIASGEVSNLPLLQRIAQTRLPVFLSTGMSPLGEIDEAVAFFKGKNVPLFVLQTTSEYPCSPAHVGLNLISFFKTRYECPVGLSDHSGKIFAGLAATALGISALEVHVTLSREAFGPDVPASLTPQELRQLTEGVCYIETMLANPVHKDVIAEELAGVRMLFSKSIVAAMDLAPGTVLEERHLGYKKPGGGLPPGQSARLIGRRLRRPVAADTTIAEGDLEC